MKFPPVSKLHFECRCYVNSVFWSISPSPSPLFFSPPPEVKIDFVPREGKSSSHYLYARKNAFNSKVSSIFFFIFNLMHGGFFSTQIIQTPFKTYFLYLYYRTPKNPPWLSGPIPWHYCRGGWEQTKIGCSCIRRSNTYCHLAESKQGNVQLETVSEASHNSKFIFPSQILLWFTVIYKYFHLPFNFMLLNLKGEKKLNTCTAAAWDIAGFVIHPELFLFMNCSLGFFVQKKGLAIYE